MRRRRKLRILQKCQRFRSKFKDLLCERRRRERNFSIFCSRAAFLCIWEKKAAQIVDLFARLGGCWSTLSTPPRYGPDDATRKCVSSYISPGCIGDPKSISTRCALKELFIAVTVQDVPVQVTMQPAINLRFVATRVTCVCCDALSQNAGVRHGERLVPQDVDQSSHRSDHHCACAKLPQAGARRNSVGS